MVPLVVPKSAVKIKKQVCHDSKVGMDVGRIHKKLTTNSPATACFFLLLTLNSLQ
jgi:hypothetical protein